MKTTLSALALLLMAVLLCVNPLHAQGVLGQMLRNNQGGRLSAILAAGTAQYTATFPAVSGTVLLNEAGVINLRPAGSATEQRFWNSAGTFYTGLRAGAATTNTTFTLPVADGAAGQLLGTIGGGQLQWFTPSADWTTNGNNGTNPTTNFLGTIDNVGIAFRTNNVQRMFLDNTGRLGINVATPTERLDINGNLKFTGSLLPGGQAGTTGQILTSMGAGQTPIWASTSGFSTSTEWSQGGNSVSAIRNIGTTSAFDLPFITSNTEKMRLTTSGRLGIGTTAPLEMLDVNGNIRLSGVGRSLIFTTPGSDPDGVIKMRRHAVSTEGSEMLFYSGNDLPGNWGPDRIRMVSNEFKVQTFNTDVNTLVEAEAENTANTRILVNSAGNVAIGTEVFDGTAPEKLLVDAGTTTSYNLINGQGSINGYLQLNIQNNSTGNLSSSDIVATANNGDESTNYIDMGINGQNYTGNFFGSANDAYLYNLGNDLLIGAGSANKTLRFLTGGSNKVSNTRMIIDGSGNVGIGTLNPIDKLTIAGNIYPTADNTYTLGRVGNRWQTVFAYNWSSPSDFRLKTNIKSLPYGLKEVLALRPVQYNWNENPNKDLKLGLIAQEVQKVVPEVVEGNQEKEMLSMDYTELIPVLINAIKEQQAQIDDLKKEISNLKKNK